MVYLTWLTNVGVNLSREQHFRTAVFLNLNCAAIFRVRIEIYSLVQHIVCWMEMLDSV